MIINLLVRNYFHYLIHDSTDLLLIREIPRNKIFTDYHPQFLL